MNGRDQDTSYGEDVLEAFAHGDDIPAIKMDALDKARKLYGPDARLQIESTSSIRTSTSGLGAFCAFVTVRRLEDGTS